MPECNHNCGECSLECGSREQTNFQEKPNPGSHIKKVIAVVSGKGGVGKSLVTSLLAVNAKRMGKKVAIIDADITGPSIPTAFGLKEKATGDGTAIFPVTSKTGIECMSLNLLMDDPSEPVVWRGPVVSGLIKQFWTEVAYGDIDELYIDMPPGTADVPLTVFQTLPIDGIVVVTTPQDLVSLIVEKALKMANMMNIKVLGIVENMSYIECPHCGERVYPYGQSDKKIEEKYGLKLLGSLPIDNMLASKVDEGNIEDYEGNYLLEVNKVIENI
ncbi:MAG: Mrp/NBP35 family ATP-binding protein [Bacilli bacterium]|nr:Mrp/NBP35 family ATP-binding protein [Bacilli bacterium]